VESSISHARRVYDRVDRVVAPSRFLGDALVEGGFRNEDIDVIPNAVETPGETAPRSLADPPRFVYFGRYVPEKGVDDLLTASASLEHDAHVEFFGEGPLGRHLEARAGKERLPATVHGHVEAADLRPVIATSVAAVLPARWHENCPMAVLEAAAQGVATIGTAMGGIPELITDGTEGLLVAPNAPHELARAMNTLLARPHVALALGRRARDRLRTQHHPDAHLAALMTTYGLAIDHRRHRAISAR
jgi:glycosyltransferase involved in cell wall biosynthesis